MGIQQRSLILISNSARAIVESELNFPPEVIVTHHLSKTLSQVIRDFGQELLPILIVGTPTELLQLRSIFQEQENTRFAWAIFSPSTYLINDLNEINPLFDFRIEKVSTSEWNFLYLKFLQWAHQLFEERNNRVIEFKINDQIMDQEALIRIGKSLSSERDQDKLLRTILFLSKKITGADAGSIFLLEERDGAKFLRFKYSHTYSMDLEYEEFVMPLDATSIAGYVTLTGKTLNIDDVYNLGPDAPIRFNSAFDQKHGYRTRSMLVTPMTDHTGKVIGVIQLINSKEKVTPERPLTGNEAFEVRLQTPEDFENLVVPFQHRYEDFMQAVAGQAAIAIENNRMIRQIERQFEEFIKAAVFAIESRDPATSGHSIRVAKMCLLLAQAINETKSGPLAELSFSNTELKELYYAALLHDFGKVYIDLSVFMKAKKLTPEQLEILKYRIALIYRTLEYERVRYQLDAKDNGTDLPNLPAENLEKLRELWHKINDLVEPAVVNSNHDEEIDLILEWIDNIHVHDLDGKLVPVLTPDEIKNLRIKRGSLNDEERAVIQSHVVHTYNFVKKIPWPEEYAQIPEIAVKHHEMLDGSGYPYQLKADQIPMQARIMALADVFDALAASDRPYKKAIPLEKVLHILKDEADQGKLDANLVQLFLDRQLYLHHQRFGELSSSEVSFLEVPNS